MSLDQAQDWILELLSVRSEQLFNNPIRSLSFAHFAHAYFVNHMTIDDFIVEGESVDKTDYQKILYIGIHRALLRSDDANIRNALLSLYAITPDDMAQFIEFNKSFDQLSRLKTTSALSRFINKNGAPLRIIRSTFFNKSGANGEVVDIQNRIKTLAAADKQIDHEYSQLKKNLRNGVIKSIIFLLITKALIGLLVEIPYDLIVYGTIIVIPLLINLLFPPLFIAITALTLKLPSVTNKNALLNYIETMLYKNGVVSLPMKVPQKTNKSYTFNVVYILMFVGVFYLVASRLIAWHFNIVQGITFFIFLSTASFLGYRLTLLVKELEVVSTNQGLIALIRDFLYAPFIFVGQRISYRFARMNLIAQILDTVIELPLKTILRLIRQWTIFLNNKKDELL